MLCNSGCALESHSACHADCMYAVTFLYNGEEIQRWGNLHVPGMGNARLKHNAVRTRRSNTSIISRRLCASV